MATVKSKEWILDAIDHLRMRKARPDIHRICLMLKRKHGLPFPDTVTCLEDLVHAGTVLKVDFKGNTSYRNAAKWKQNSLGGHLLNSTTVSEILKEAIAAVSKKIDNEDGADEWDIKNWLCVTDSANHWTSVSLTEALKREVAPGNICRLADGRYCLFSSLQERKKKKIKMKPKKMYPNACNENAQQTESGGDLSGNGKKRGRPPSKRKKFKKLHHDDYISTDAIIADKHSKRETASQKDEDDQMCDFCESKSNKNGETEQLLVCTDCTATAHPSCMGYSEVLARRARLSPWQCIDCKTCFVCDGSENADALLFCDFCDKGCHMACHSPPIKEKPKGKWMCINCQMDGVEEQGNDSTQEDPELMESLYTYDGADASFPPTPCDSDSDVHDQHERDSSSEKSELNKLRRSPLVKKHMKNGKFPDASEWTIDDVYNFFSEIGFPEQANAFIDQEIDGKSLLLMKRSDVLTGMSFKLGPALKIYQYVEGLQMAGCS
ncbi:histone acetyltransferase KAT6B-like isoform X2 [Gigantopelta aegis]|uniref:histone acetyltransferase KAT6B-like isoform X2 n=1 Tax=Gigantopelta aegis TaxID=1735272 RepID=UPI001B889507|nr:histone acetyltransferase KAT6B-like isoform X2 [Gigantopelta aegis]